MVSWQPDDLGVSRFASHIPNGRAIDDDQFELRHRIIGMVLLAHIPALFLIGVLNGYAVWHTVLEASPVAVLAFLGQRMRHRLPRSIATSMGLVYAAATLIHFAGGIIEAHFHWFVVLTLTALYVDLRPFVPVLGFTAVHHAIMSFYDPTLLFEHERGQQNPLLWTGVHVIFVVMLIGALAINWYTLQVQHDRWVGLSKSQQKTLDDHALLRRQREALVHTQQENLELQILQAELMAERSSELATSSVRVREVIGETSSTMSAMTTTAGSISDDVHEVLELAVKANEEAATTREVVDELDERSRRITEMVDLISEIADKTNLLALNATIEAERAGTAGRGFTVVATEVKGLAKKTSHATDQIRSITDDLQSRVTTSAARVTGVAELVDSIVERQRQVEHDVLDQRDTADQARNGVEAASATMLDIIQGIEQLELSSHETLST